jgi:aminocarboxymuconate-semialdehyde decarboxylase
MAGPLCIVDFHCHHVPARFELTTVANAPPTQKARWAATNKVIADEAALLLDIEAGDIAVRVINTPTAHICDAEGHVPHATIMAVNDELARIVDRHKGRIIALATVDGYDGEASARELERAVTQLGLRGVFLECARGARMIDCPEARPTLETAARLGIPAFVHPVNPQPMTTQMEPYGRLGTLLARGTINSASLVALIESGAFTVMPGLKVVVTALAMGGLAMAAGFSHMSRLPGGTRDVLRRHVFIEMMGFHPALIRTSVEMLGAGNVLVGSDWPIVSDGPIRQTVASALADAGLAPAEQAQVAGGNALRLLGAEPS